MLTKGLTIATALVIGLLLAGGAYYWQTGHCPFCCDSPAPAAPSAGGEGGGCGGGACAGTAETAACTGGTCGQDGAAVAQEGKECPGACAGENSSGKAKCCAETACFDPNAPKDTKTADKTKTETQQKKAPATTEGDKAKTTAGENQPK
jgi:hypothetical protein